MFESISRVRIHKIKQSSYKAISDMKIGIEKVKNQQVEQ